MIESNFDEIPRVRIDQINFENFTQEEEFTEIAVEIFKETVAYLLFASHITGYSETWNRDQAAVGGNMIRLYKLCDALLDQVCKHRREICEILLRLCFENVVNIRFLLKNYSPEIINSYISFSLRHEKKLYDEINENIKNRSGKIIPIEERMLKSIDLSFQDSGITLGELNTKIQKWGNKTLHEKARDIDLSPMYDHMFGGMSHSVHGAWQDLSTHHLEILAPNQFKPVPHWSNPRPQTLDPIALLVVDTIIDYLNFICKNNELDEIKSRLLDVKDRIYLFISKHEEYLALQMNSQT